MSEHADVVVVHYPRGVTALVWLDLVTGVVTTNHSGLRVALRQGVKNWAGEVVHPYDGPIFLAAVFDRFFVSGYPVRWLSVSGLKVVQQTYRV
jgi:hypothetical protein